MLLRSSKSISYSQYSNVQKAIFQKQLTNFAFIATRSQSAWRSTTRIITWPAQEIDGPELRSSRMLRKLLLQEARHECASIVLGSWIENSLDKTALRLQFIRIGTTVSECPPQVPLLSEDRRRDTFGKPSYHA